MSIKEKPYLQRSWSANARDDDAKMAASHVRACLFPADRWLCESFFPSRVRLAPVVTLLSIVAGAVSDGEAWGGTSVAVR